MKRFSKLLLFILSLCVFLTPITVLAADKSYEIDKFISFAVIGDKGTAMADSQNLTVPAKTNVRDGVCEQDKDYVFFEFSAPAAIPKNSTISLDIDFWNGRIYGFSSVIFNGNAVDDFKYDISTDNLVASFYNKEVISKGQRITLTLKGIHYNPAFNTNTPPLCLCNGFDIDVTDEKTGKLYQFFDNIRAWFNNLFQWLKDIRDNAVDGFKNIGSWFSDLGNNIKTWFSNLSNKLKDWFSSLGDRISSFFTNLWDNISSNITNIKLSIQEWWQSVKDFFHSLFVPEDGYFDEYKNKFDLFLKDHFGLLYETTDFISEFMDYLSYIDEELADPNVTIPKISFSVQGHDFTVIPSTVWNLNNYIINNSILYKLFTMLQVLISAFFYYALFLFARSTFNKILNGGGVAS